MKPVLTGTAPLAEKLRKAEITVTLLPSIQSQEFVALECTDALNLEIFGATRFRIQSPPIRCLNFLPNGNGFKLGELWIPPLIPKKRTCQKNEGVQCSPKRVFSRNSQQGPSLVVVVWQFDLCLGWWQFVLCKLLEWLEWFLCWLWMLVESRSISYIYIYY